jgi:hypothetical protein
MRMSDDKFRKSADKSLPRFVAISSANILHYEKNIHNRSNPFRTIPELEQLLLT